MLIVFLMKGVVHSNFISFNHMINKVVCLWKCDIFKRILRRVLRQKHPRLRWCTKSIFLSTRNSIPYHFRKKSKRSVLSSTTVRGWSQKLNGPTVSALFWEGLINPSIARPGSNIKQSFSILFLSYNWLNYDWFDVNEWDIFELQNIRHKLF